MRHKGFSNEDAKEYTQDFLTQILLGKEFISKVDRGRGKKFRSFLIKAFLHHVYGRLRKKRERLLDDEAIDANEPCAPDVDAARVFDFEWAVTILRRVLADIEAQCLRENQRAHWGAFRERVLIPALDGMPPLPLPDVCRKYGISAPEQASSMIVTVKRKFKTTLERCLGNYADSPEQWQEQLDDFICIFSRE